MTGEDKVRWGNFVILGISGNSRIVVLGIIE